MKKLIKMFKSLPREVRMLIAMAGLASPIGIIYLLKRVLFPGMSTLMVIFIVMGIVAVLCLVGFFVAKLFGRGGKRRSKRMAEELGREDSQGPVSVDVRASIKANNDKFFAAIRDMRKNLGISVYDLPWYIVMGDSGCGKTRLINNGGLTFSTGRPEGYQLGTLNYNWWFSEDAVFVDMAGRLCNPQEDADHREWQAFLSTIAKGRKGFPINGALVCISAEHLLQDSPEKHEADANTALERLREMQSKLGVTFATYLVITKCDKILGFMQFFDRAGRDITIKNQIFGWSKSGPFNEMYDPERFGEDFEALYHRLNELRMRRLNDDVDEIERGLAYSFPEEFRELRDPLQTYLRTLFPMIKNPRAIKNLIFRGTYFTSATQEGELILKHLADRLGSEAANQFPTLDSLYPEKRPLFVKDVLFKKVFPEHGLVFRNEADVVRNRKLAKLLKVGSVVLFVILASVFWWSASKLTTLMTDPRNHALEAPEQRDEPVLALNKAQELSDDVATLKRNRGVARILSMGIGAGKPIEGLGTIRARLFEDGALKHAMADIDAALRAGASKENGEAFDRAAQAHMDAFEQYVTWYGCINEPNVSKPLTYDSFKTMAAVVTDPKSIIVTHKETFLEEAHAYFETIHRRADAWKSPALFLKEGLDPAETIRQATKQVHHYLRDRYALLENSSNPLVREWMRIHKQCAEIERTYGVMLDTDLEQIDTIEALRAFSKQFRTSHSAFEKALDATGWQGGGAVERIRPLNAALLELRKFWVDYDKRLVDALNGCGAIAPEDIERILPSLERGGGPDDLVGLDAVLWESLRKAGLTQYEWKADQNYYDEDTFKTLIIEVYQAFPQIIQFVKGETGKPDRIVLTGAATKVRRILSGISEKLAKTSFEAPEDARSDTVGWWIEQLEDRLYADDEEPTGPEVPKDLNQAWRPDDLARLNQEHLSVIRLGEGRVLLQRIADRLASENIGEWGFAELVDEWHKQVKSSYSIVLTEASEPVGRAQRDRSSSASRKKKSRRKPPRARHRKRERAEPVQTRRRSLDRPEEIPDCATPAFVGARAEECVKLMYYVALSGDDFYLKQADASQPLHEECLSLIRGAWEQYAQRYAKDWRAAYQGKSLDALPNLENWDDDWEVFARQFTKKRARDAIDPRKVVDEFEPALDEILHATRWVTFDPGLGWWHEDDGEMATEWREAADAIDGAMKDEWPEDSFAVHAENPAGEGKRRDPPWVVLATSFRDRWNELTDAIGKSYDLESRFERKRKYKFERIPWGQIGSLKTRSRLDDEKLTSDLVSFERQAQQLLSVELTQILADIQKRYLGHRSPPDGWPYLGGGWPKDSGMETVDFKAFKDFLYEVARAQDMFALVEEGLADDDFRQARLRFYKQCKAWFDFLALQGEIDSSLTATPLDVEIHGDDPKSDRKFDPKVDDTAQHHYRYTELSIGLKLTKDDSKAGGAAAGAVRLETDVERGYVPRSAVWEWEEQSDEADLTMALVDPLTEVRGPATGKRGPMTLTIGKSSPMALCAYLHAYGYGEGKVWQTLNRFRIGKEEDPDAKVLGAMYVFNLNRPMPGPIRKLEPMGADGRRRGSH